MKEAVMDKVKEQKSAPSDRHCVKIEVPLEEEVIALNAMRAIKEEGKRMKERVAFLRNQGDHKDTEELLSAEREIERLRREWLNWEDKRKRAAKMRMVLLGHEDPDFPAFEEC